MSTEEASRTRQGQGTECAEEQREELEEVCAVPDCPECDFLPGTCEYCAKMYCHVHLTDHQCRGVGIKDRRVDAAGAGGGSLQELENVVATSHGTVCGVCGEPGRYLVQCTDSACSGKQYCVQHRFHESHTGNPSAAKSRLKPVPTSRAAPSVGSRRGLPVPLGRFSGGSRGVLGALLVQIDEQGPSTTDSSSNAPIYLHPTTVGEGLSKVNRILLTDDDSAEQGQGNRCVAVVLQSKRKTGEGTGAWTGARWVLCFAQLAQGSSLGNIFDCIDIQLVKQNGAIHPKRCEVFHHRARALTGTTATTDPEHCSLPPGTALVQDALSDRCAIVLSLRVDELQTGPAIRPSEVSKDVLPAMFGKLAGFLPPAPLLPSGREKTETEVEPKKEVADDTPVGGSALAPEQQVPGGPSDRRVGVDELNSLQYPTLTDLPFSHPKLKPLGVTAAKGATRKAIVAVISLIPLPTGIGHGAVVALPKGFCLWVNLAWPKGKLLDRIAEELNQLCYNVVDASKKLAKLATSTGKLATSTSTSTSATGTLDLYNLKTLSILDTVDRLKNGDVLGVYLGDRPGLPQSVVAQLKPLAAMSPQEIPKATSTRMMKDCCVS